jgi:hypothetical protein
MRIGWRLFLIITNQKDTAMERKDSKLRLRIPVILSLAVLVLLGSLGVGNRHAGIGDIQSDTERAQEAARAYMGALQGVLMKELREGGPVKAIAVCADTAQRLTADLGTEMGVSLKRVSDRVRNPANKPDAYESAVLDRFSVMQGEGDTDLPFIHTEYRTFNGKKEFWYIQSIHLQAQCIGCHGNEEQIAENVRARLRERYPDDRAVQYAPGDLRGALRISFPVEE